MYISNGKSLFILASCILVMSFFVSASTAQPAEFDDLALSSESYWNGSDESGGFSSGGAFFNNSFTDWGGGAVSWEGFAYSNITDTAADGLGAQYNAIAGTGAGSTANYGIGFVGWGLIPTITLDAPSILDSLCLTNDNYSYYSMLNGDDYAKKFGGPDGTKPDWFMLTITGKDSQGTEARSVDFYLADYRFADSGLDYIIDDWVSLDLTALGAVASLEFTLSSSDVGLYGMNTPAYFAIDTIVPEPVTALLLGLGGFVSVIRRKRLIR